jgi:glyoxylase-like metal-dependent hydrolase (beta-lactamase superfamily II)
MNEVLPGVFHWSSFHPGIKQVVHSHYWAPGKTVTDPLLPDDADAVIEELRDHGVNQIVLSNRHHWRSSSDLREAFPGVPVLCNDQGLYEFTDDDERDVEPFAVGSMLAPGLKALELGGICDDDTALWMDTEGGALLFADALIMWDGEPAFVPDFLLGEPERDKERMREALRRLMDENAFDSLFFAHGEPLIGGGREALRAFLAKPGEQQSVAGFSD